MQQPSRTIATEKGAKDLVPNAAHFLHAWIRAVAIVDPVVVERDELANVRSRLHDRVQERLRTLMPGVFMTVDERDAPRQHVVILHDEFQVGRRLSSSIGDEIAPSTAETFAADYDGHRTFSQPREIF